VFSQIGMYDSFDFHVVLFRIPLILFIKGRIFMDDLVSLLSG
jgi:hypothetical protein